MQLLHVTLFASAVTIVPCLAIPQRGGFDARRRKSSLFTAWTFLGIDDEQHSPDSSALRCRAEVATQPVRRHDCFDDREASFLRRHRLDPVRNDRTLKSERATFNRQHIRPLAFGRA